MLTLSQKIVVSIFIIWEQKKTRDYDNNPVVKEATIESHFDFRLNGSIDVDNNSSYSRDDKVMVMLCFVMN